ncbi:XRE family transcriptional regulator [Pseudonocardiaceae bacterium YIM PH 21723]|nr:XRE family transcriptional regulator [Pseudonocardiaceae bacterium YIM PH 21723]
MDELVSTLDASWDTRLTRLSQQDTVVVRPLDGLRIYRTTQVLRATVDGPDRWVVVQGVPDGEPVPEVVPLRNCRLGRQIERAEHGIRACELVFDRPLRRGETVIIEHAIVNRSAHPDTDDYERLFRVPTGLCVIELDIDPAPGSLVQYTVDAEGTENGRDVPPVTGTHLVVTGFGPGRCGFRWSWT